MFWAKDEDECETEKIERIKSQKDMGRKNKQKQTTPNQNQNTE